MQYDCVICKYVYCVYLIFYVGESILLLLLNVQCIVWGV